MVDVRRLLRPTLLLTVIAANAICRIGLADCSLTSTGLVPLNDLGPEKYSGVTGGLYPNGAKNPQLVIVDGAQGGQDASRWTDPNAPTWATVNSRLRTAGVTPAQVQVAWVKQALAHPSSLGMFPAHAQVLQSDLEQIARNLKTNYPNIKLAYLSSRTRPYTNDPNTLNPEPFAYESGFAVRWAIADQLASVSNLNFDPS